MTTDDPADETTATPDYRQVSIIALAALAVVLAAFFAPGMAGQSGSSADGDGPGTGVQPDSAPDADGPEPTFDWTELLEWLDLGRGGESPTGTVEPADPECTIGLSRDPVPGSEIVVTVVYRGEPLADAPVWFNDRAVGETNERGQVAGEVPYDETLVIRVGADDEAACRAAGTTTSEFDADSERDSRGAVTAATTATAGTAAIAGTSTSSGSTAASGASATARVPTNAGTTQRPQSENTSVEYDVEGDVEILLHGDPYPGDRVTLEAAIDGVPMRSADVTVDGESVGETDDNGTATLAVPDDGTERIDIGVARGDFAGTATVDVLLLRADLSPGGLAPVPGSDGHVVAEIAGEPVDEATVTVGGDRLGTTGADGRLGITLPRDPTTTVTVSTDDQTATVTLVDAYGRAVALASLVVAGLAAVAYRTHGRRGPAVVVGIVVGAVLVLVTEAFYGPKGGLAALGIGLAVGLAVGQRRSDRSVTDGRSSVQSAFDRLIEWLVARAFGVVDVLERVLDRLWSLFGAVRAWLGSLPRSVTGLSARLAGWLGSVPGRTIAGLRCGVTTLRRLPLRTGAALAGAGLPVAGGYAVDGPRGAAATAAVLAGAGIVVLRSRRRTRDPQETSDDGDRADPELDDATPRATDEHPSFREVWRSFAREVDPNRWRTRTPGEIERQALQDGYPRAPVTELTTLFRDIEYGGRARSPTVRDRAADIYAELTAARGEGSDPSSGDDTPDACGPAATANGHEPARKPESNRETASRSDTEQRSGGMDT
ncbi:DUF4129 domain-containing protein [Halopiger djelfimassiliensis]|uniref:DUF4129 domain-containing protein n=1 Tax=Halopiger djelfimassiliensis TaxID=1293047 RepID=UPI000677943F|nr:DUF4129 domain-containing protein [Halopiger djelfimassiliensis]